MTPPSSPGPLTVRDAVAADLPTIVEFNRRLASETENKVLDLAKLERGVEIALREPDRLRYWVAEAADGGVPRVVGQTAITREWSDLQRLAGGSRAFMSIRTIAAGACSGPSTGTSATSRRARRTSSASRLYVENGNLRAQQTYQSLGMKPGGYSVLEGALDRPPRKWI
ncbi:MAG: GNAT family N-acetyltransferase [Isosphaeraceae bacterium]